MASIARRRGAASGGGKASFRRRHGRARPASREAGPRILDLAPDAAVVLVERTASAASAADRCHAGQARRASSASAASRQARGAGARRSAARASRRIAAGAGLLGGGPGPSASFKAPQAVLLAEPRAAAVGASAAAAKPSQRHRSPSRETRRWPGASAGCSAEPRWAPGHPRPVCDSRTGSSLGAHRGGATRARPPPGRGGGGNGASARQWAGAQLVGRRLDVNRRAPPQPRPRSQAPQSGCRRASPSPRHRRH